MNKSKAEKAIESFENSSHSVIYDPSAPVTQKDFNELVSKIASLARDLVDAIQE